VALLAHLHLVIMPTLHSRLDPMTNLQTVPLEALKTSKNEQNEPQSAM